MKYYTNKEIPNIVITKPYGKWKKGDKPTVLVWKANELIKAGVARKVGRLKRKNDGK